MPALENKDIDENKDDPFSCFGSEDGDDDDDDETRLDFDKQQRQTDVLHAMERSRRLIGQANNAPQIHLPISSPDSFEVVDIPSAGKGLCATRRFQAGDEILRESAVMRVPNHQAASSLAEAEERHFQAVQKSFDSLHSATQQAVLELSSCNEQQHDDEDHDDDERRTPLGVYQTNSFQLGEKESYGALFLTIARVNHSCRPNCNHIWRPDLQQTAVFAIRDIEIGEELSTTYGPSECLDTAGRQAYLLGRFSFICTCEMCVEGNTNGGDDRMNALNFVQEKISLLIASGKPEEAIEEIEHCLALLKQQGLGTGAFCKPILHYGYQVALGGLHNVEMARAYLSKELISVKHCQGVGSPTAVKIQYMLDDIAVT